MFIIQRSKKIMQFIAMISAPCAKCVSKPALKGRENREHLRPK
jgi:hypothetical protein